MKTLDEALDVITTTSLEDVPRLRDELAKFQGMIREICENSRVAALRIHNVEAQTSLGRPDDLLHRIYLSGFVDGVKIGMEMERSDGSPVLPPCGTEDQGPR